MLRHASQEHSEAAEDGTSSNSLKMDFLKIPLNKINEATKDFSEECRVGSGGYGKVYKAKLDIVDIQCLSSMEGKCKDELPKISKRVAIKRISSEAHEYGKQGFLTEIELLATCKHQNIVSLHGYSEENDEMILVYEFVSNGSLADYLLNSDKTRANLTWAQRLQICLDIANGIDYLHTHIEGKRRILHRDIKSDNILLDENLNAKIGDFGLSKFHPIKQQASSVYSKNVVGTDFYTDPEYLNTFKYKRESDIYSFGVVLFEVLSGKLAYDSNYTSKSRTGIAPIARTCFKEGRLEELIDPNLIKEVHNENFKNRRLKEDSFKAFSKIAYQCLKLTQAKRPTNSSQTPNNGSHHQSHHQGASK